MTKPRKARGAAILTALSAPFLIVSAATPSGGERFLVSPVREWTYELQVHGSLGVHFDPYFVNSVLLASSLSHGSRQNSNDGKSVKFTLRASAKPLNGEQQLELDEAAKKAFFGPAVTRASLVVVRSVDPLAENHPWNFKGLDRNGAYKPLLPFPHPVLALEIRGTMDMKKDDPWILSEVLAFIPADGKTSVDHLGWITAPVTAPVEVPAGTFQRVFVSRRPRGDGRNSPRHTLESWVAEGVGLVKLVALSQENKSLYTLQLTAYK